MSRKLPALHLYIGDLLKDPGFLLCDWQAQNLWLRLLLHLHEMPHRGRFLKRDGVTVLSNEEMAKLCQMPMAEFEKLIWQLLKNDVASVIDGAIANRRMVKEAELHETKSESGKRGAAARWQMNGTGDGKALASGMPYNSSSISESYHDKKKNKTSLAPKTEARAAISAETWKWYSEAYLARYKTLPVRNQKVNSELKKLVELLGAEEAPQVAAFYLTCSLGLYVSSRHPTNLLVRDASGLRTQWKTNTRATKSEIRTAETGSNMNEQLKRILQPASQIIDVTPPQQEKIGYDGK